ncbi:uncharacterized protein BBOV_IV010435 [Babesia bovis T2Bo]|uniref:uncharacterized protein n=1 Tax=Babesia bovis T2Bo TaxID=484906 RepID=UPI001DC18B38|nr:uncharacterized protein BBOV_IV010435 [Babesia bovis T2Bo]KAG6439959.1 hypothetical protein BBOV_IV010435 [Babesia bovis T2Bo]
MYSAICSRPAICYIALIALYSSRTLQMTDARDACLKDYSQSCPEGWTESIVYSAACEAPINYIGPCATRLPVVMTKQDKVELEEKCNINWPCFNTCDIEENAKCPIYWYMEDNVCKPSPGYSGRCVEPMDPNQMHQQEKILWGNRCQVKWPCKKKCNTNYYAKCPEGWQLDG